MNPSIQPIRPWHKDPRYWEMGGQPLLLIGGSVEDNLFQWPDLDGELDRLVRHGANVVRNTMSDRDPWDVYPYDKEGELYDLNKPNPEYWRRFRCFINGCAQRGIVVQLEIWDRFDLSDAKGMFNWQSHPYNPSNNVNYTEDQTGLEGSYLKHPSSDEHPFYHTVPGSEKYLERYDALRPYQTAFVDRILEVTLPAPNVLYCMNNETSSCPQWGRYWIRHIKKRAAEAGVEVQCTDMFDDAHKTSESPSFCSVLENPETYDFVEISQVNSRNFGSEHGHAIRWVCEQVKDRPVNHTKIYSDGGSGWGSGSPQEGIARYWRNLLAGSASVRFHRPGSGIVSGELSQACWRATRGVEAMVRFWELHPLDLGHPDEVLTAARSEKGTTVVFLPEGKAVELELPGSNCTWFSVANGSCIRRSEDCSLSPPLSGPMVAVIEA